MEPIGPSLIWREEELCSGCLGTCKVVRTVVGKEEQCVMGERTARAFASGTVQDHLDSSLTFFL